MKRFIVGIPFNYDESWIGGAYYVKNLVSSLNLLDADRQPEVWMISNKMSSFEFIKDSSRYPHLHWIRDSDLKKANGDTRKRGFWARLFGKRRRKVPDFDVIFPYPVEGYHHISAAWIPDFQEKYLPQFFSPDELEERDRQHRFYIDNFRHIVFSSRAAEADFQTFYPDNGVKTHVVHFATFEKPVQTGDAAKVLEKYDLPARFFYCPNQFWIHKNHAVVIDAVKILKDRGVEVCVAFSGKEHDHRAPDHVNQLKARVQSLGVEGNVRFLGFIPRDDQMVIFRQAISVVQPSFFEGWSTVIEDAKSVSQNVLASRIPANLEQVDDNITYFDPHSAEDLAGLLEKYLATLPDRKVLDYRRYQQDFADNFMALVADVARTRRSG